MKLYLFIITVLSALVIFSGCSEKQQENSQHQLMANETYNTHGVDIQNYVYNPENLTIHVGDKVIWANLDDIPHTITSIDGNELNSQLIRTGNQYTHRFFKAGTYEYYSKKSYYNTKMRGVVIVE